MSTQAVPPKMPSIIGTSVYPRKLSLVIYLLDNSWRDAAVLEFPALSPERS